MIDVAVIGAGAISSFHLDGYRAFPDRCRVVAVADTDLARAQQRIEEYRLTDAVAFDSVDAVLGDGPNIDLASVCTPPSSHAEIAARLLNAGVNTLLEKPMAPSLAECDAILAAADRGGAVLSVVAQNRFTNPMMRLKQVLDSGLAGRVLHAQVDSHWWRGPSYYDLWWRGTWQSEGGGCTLNHAVHHIDALQWMVGTPVAIQAMIGNVNHGNSEVEDLSLAIMRFPDGALGQITSLGRAPRTGSADRLPGRAGQDRDAVDGGRAGASSPTASPSSSTTRRPSGSSTSSTRTSRRSPTRATPARSTTC